MGSIIFIVEIFNKVTSLLNEYISEEDEPFQRLLIEAEPSDAFRVWIRFINYKATQFDQAQLEDKQKIAIELAFTFERALSIYPKNYKIWNLYLNFRSSLTEPYTDIAEVRKVCHCFQRALDYLPTMPKIWTLYLRFLTGQYKITYTRRIFNKALQSLPTTQHNLIWPLYSKWARKIGGKTTLVVLQRFIKYDTFATLDVIQSLIEEQFYDESAHLLLKLTNDDKNNFDLWQRLCHLLTDHPSKITCLSPDKLFRMLLRNFTDQAGNIWIWFATMYINLGNNVMARCIFEEALANVTSALDFTKIFESYLEMEESILADTLHNLKNTWDKHTLQKLENEADFLLAAFENLLDRRAWILNDILLRQNCNQVSEWQKRIGLCHNNNKLIMETYLLALNRIVPGKAIGNFSQLWIDFANFYSNNNNLMECRKILEKAIAVPFKDVDDLTNIYCAWAEIEIKHQNFDMAKRIFERATLCPKYSNISYFDSSLTPQQRIHKSCKLWNHFLAFEEEYGNIDSTKAIFERFFDLKIATLQTIDKYASFLAKNDLIEESFQIYERGIILFSYPTVFELWNIYLVKHVDYYKGSCLERTRDLFEQALEGCPIQFKKSIFIYYANWEEKYGLIKTAITLLERALNEITRSDKYPVYELLISKKVIVSDISSVRDTFEKALNEVDVAHLPAIAVRFAKFEIGENCFHNARKIFQFAAHYISKPSGTFWDDWNQFELDNGNEDTYKEMLKTRKASDNDKLR